MNFFFDNNISPRFAQALNVLSKNHNVTWLREKFERGDIPDAMWMNELSKEGNNWIIISGDVGILKVPHEIEKLLQTGFTFFVLTGSFLEKDYWSQIKRLVAVWPEIIELAKLHPKETIFSVPYTGKIRKI